MCACVSVHVSVCAHVPLYTFVLYGTSVETKKQLFDLVFYLVLLLALYFRLADPEVSGQFFCLAIGMLG